MTQDFSIIHLLLNASWVVQAVVLLLMGVSVASWTAIFRKIISLKRVHALNEEFERDFWSGTSLNELFAAATKNARDAGPMERIFASGMRQFVHEAFIIKALLRRIDRAPCARLLVRNMRKMPTRYGGQDIGEYRLVLGAFGLGIIIAVRRDAFLVGQCRLQNRGALRAIGALRDLFLPAPD